MVLGVLTRLAKSAQMKKIAKIERDVFTMNLIQDNSIVNDIIYVLCFFGEFMQNVYPTISSQFFPKKERSYIQNTNLSVSHGF